MHEAAVFFSVYFSAAIHHGQRHGTMLAKILVAVGARPSADIAIADGLQLAIELNAVVTFIHVVTAFDLPIIDAPARAYLSANQLSAGLDEAAAPTYCAVMAQSRAIGLDVAFTVAAGISITRGIADFAREQRCGLIVVGSSRRGRWHPFVRGVADGLARISDVPIWVSSQQPWRQAGMFESRRARQVR